MITKTAEKPAAPSSRLRTESQKRESNNEITHGSKKSAAYNSFLGFSSPSCLSNPMSVALNARARHFDLPLDDAGSQMAATYLGRMCLKKYISPKQYDAAQQFLLLRYHYLKSLQPLATPLPQEEEKTHTNFCRQAKLQYFAALLIVEIVRKERPHGKITEALQYLVIDDQEMPHLLVDCRIILNRLHHHFISP